MHIVFKTAVVALAIASCAAASATPSTTITLDFTGTVTSGDGLFNTLAYGSKVTGTYIFDFAVANPGQSYGTIGDLNANWSVQLYGVGYGNPIPKSYVFSAVVNARGQMFKPITDRVTSYTSVFGGNFGKLGNFQAYQSTIAAYGGPEDGSDQVSSEFDSTGPMYSFGSDGLPIFVPGNNVYGNLVVGHNGISSTLDYNITSLSAVPEVSTCSLMLAGLGMVGIATMRRKTLKS